MSNELKTRNVTKYIEKIKQLQREGKIRKSQIALVVLCVAAVIFLSIPNAMQLNRNSIDESKSSKGQSKTAALKRQENANEVANSSDEYVLEKEKQLERLLSKVRGVGSVDVMITLKDSGEHILNKDITKSEQTELGEHVTSKSDSEYQEQTVVVESKDGDQAPLITREVEPEIMGVVVICEGGDDPRVVTDICSAVEVLFSVSAHKVKVMKKVS